MGLLSTSEDTLCVSNDEEQSVRALHVNNRWLLQVSQKRINTLCRENTRLINVTARRTVRISKDIGLHQSICMCPLFPLPTLSTRRPERLATYRHQHALKSHVRSRGSGSSQIAFDRPLVSTIIQLAVSGTTSTQRQQSRRRIVVRHKCCKCTAKHFWLITIYPPDRVKPPSVYLYWKR